MIYIISKSTFGEYAVRDIQCNANWCSCPYSDYVLIPDDLVEGILATQGYCDITLNADGTEVASFTAREIPSVPEECHGTNTVLSVNGVTADTEGAVTLTQSDIGGIASLEHGGTGRNFSDVPPYAVIRATSDLDDYPYLYYTATGNGAFYATSTNGAPKFGTLPIAQGGTGAKTAEAARSNLGYDYAIIRDFSRLGLSGAVTTQQVFEAMPSYTICVITNSKSSETYISDAPNNYCLIELVKAASYGTARATQAGSTVPQHWIAGYYNGSNVGFTGWRCLDPQGMVGTEYLIAERCGTKPVYTKLVDMGTVTNGTEVTYYDSKVYPIRYAAYNDAGIAFPLFMEPALNSTYKAWVDVNANKITARFNNGFSTLRIYCQVWYTKT